MRQTAAAPAPVAATPAAPAAAPQPAPPGVSLQPVLSGEPLPAHDDDPLAMFGGLPPAAATGAPPAPAPAAVADIDDGLLAAFAAPSPAPAAAPQQQQQQAEAEQGSLSADFGDFKGSEGHEAPAPRHGPAPSGGSLSRPAGGAGPTSGFGYERPASSGSQGGTAGQSRYRVFDYVDSQPADEPSAGAAAAAAAGAGSGPGRAPSRGHLQAAAPARSGPLEDGARRAAAAAAGPGSGVLHAGSYAPQPAGKEVVSELGHKAAKALQSGTKWFARASKALASQVQHRLQQHGGAAGGSGATASGSAAGACRQADGNWGLARLCHCRLLLLCGPHAPHACCHDSPPSLRLQAAPAVQPVAPPPSTLTGPPSWRARARAAAAARVRRLVQAARRDLRPPPLRRRYPATASSLAAPRRRALQVQRRQPSRPRALHRLQRTTTC